MTDSSLFHYHQPSRLGQFLERSLRSDSRKHGHTINVVGTHSALAISLGFALNNSSQFNKLSSLIVVPSFEDARRIKSTLLFFSSKIRCHILDGFDVSPYMGLYPSPHVVKDRCGFLYWADFLEKKPALGFHHIFIATMNGLLQKTAPKKDFAARSWSFKQNDELPHNLPQFFNELGYQSAPLVEDRGQYSIRGGIVDIYSVAEEKPTRFELFGDQIERIRQFSVDTQVSQDEITEVHLAPAHEVNLNDDSIEDLLERLNAHFSARTKDKVNPADKEDALRSISQKNYLQGVEYALPFNFEKLDSVFSYFSKPVNLFLLDPAECQRVADEKFAEALSDYKNQTSSLFRPNPETLYLNSDRLIGLENNVLPPGSTLIRLSNLAFHTDEDKINDSQQIEYTSLPLKEFSQISLSLPVGSADWISSIHKKLVAWEKKNSLSFYV